MYGPMNIKWTRSSFHQKVQAGSFAHPTSFPGILRTVTAVYHSHPLRAEAKNE